MPSSLESKNSNVFLALWFLKESSSSRYTSVMAVSISEALWGTLSSNERLTIVANFDRVETDSDSAIKSLINSFGVRVKE